VFSRLQALDEGATPRLISSRLRSGRWILEAPSVYGLPGHPDTWRRRLWIAYLTAGPTALVGFQAAGCIHGMHPIAEGWLTLIVDRPVRYRPPGAIWHRLDDVVEAAVELRDGFRLTTPDRTIVDLSSVLRKGPLAELVEDALVNKIVSIASVGSVLERVRRRGKPGVQKLCDALDLLGPGDGIPRSKLEHLLDDVIGLSGLPTPVHEHPLPSVQCLTGFVDRYFPEAHLIVEADGRKWHERRRNMARDAERDIEAARCGKLTSRLMWEHLSTDPHGMARALVDIHRSRT
jgi:hypothetical protein